MQACRGSKSQTNVFDEVRVESVVKFQISNVFALSFIYLFYLFIYLFIYFLLDSFLCFFDNR